MFNATQVAKRVKAQTKTKADVLFYKGEGYFYFVYDYIVDGKVIVHESHSIMCGNLAFISIEGWTRYGVDFVNEMDTDHAERLAA